jgi:hypothetical protein
MILNREDALYAANIFIDYFQNFGRIDDYLRKVKLERMSNYPTSLPGMGPQDDMFSDFTMHPNDMEFECREVTPEIFVNYLEITTSHAVEASSVGKSIRWVVYEKNTGKIAGFIKLGSPTINSRPRNEFLGKPLNTSDDKVMKRFNDSCIMGFIIVPTQPFGFNYLGGKLLAAICCSHHAKDALDKKYGGPFCMFETTSLYGSTKSSSQYDGMKPFLRYKGNTESDFAPLINDENYRKLFNWFTDRNDGVELVPAKTERGTPTASRKLKAQTKMMTIIRHSLKGTPEQVKFIQACTGAKNLTEKKRTYISDYGFDNVKEYLNFETDELRKKDKWARYSMQGVTDWWRNKASKRYESLKADGRLRTELETFNVNGESIIIIR